MARRPFDILRACFLLLAATISVALFGILMFESLCGWAMFVSRVEPIGACAHVGEQIREVWEFILTTVLALLLAGRSLPPPPPDDDQDK